MKKTSVKMAAVLLSMLLVLCSGCGNSSDGSGLSFSNENGNETSAESLSSGKGRYVEEEYILPDGSSSVYAINILSDGSVRLITEMGIYDSGDGGETWSKSELGSSFYEEGHLGFISAGIDQEGNMLLCMFEEEAVYYYISNQGETHKVDLLLPEINIGSGENGMFYYGGEEDGVQEGPMEAQEADGTEEGSMITQAADGTEEGTTGTWTEGNLPEEQMSVLATGDGEEMRLINASMLTKIDFTSDGHIIAKDIMEGLYLIDAMTGEILNTYMEPGTGTIKTYTCIGEKLVVYTASGIEIYSLATGDLLEADEILNNYFAKDTVDNSLARNTVIMGGSGSKIIMAAGNAADELFFMDSTGLYRYIFGSGAVEEVMNGSLYSMSAPSSHFGELLIREDNSVLIVYQDFSGSFMNAKLMNYIYDGEASAVPSKELTIYTLADNQNIRQAITQFQKMYPDYYINLEVGMNGEDAVTVSDALRSLNTDILAGTGPDILLLDSMPVESYIEKGLLYDLREVVEAAGAENDFFENVLRISETEEGIFAVPTRFSIPVIAGLKENLDGINSLDTLAAGIVALRMENPDSESILGFYTAGQLGELLYDSSSGSFVKDDGSLNEAKIHDFLTRLKEIYDQNTLEDFSEIDMDPDLTLRNIVPILSHQQLLNIGKLTGISDLNTLLSVNEKAGWEYQLFNGQTENTLIPMNVVGVNAKSNNIEVSLEIMKALLSPDMQKISQSPGFPVNRDAFDALCREQLNTGENVMEIMINVMTEDGLQESVNIVPGTQEDYEQLKDYLSTVEIPANTNEIIKSAVLEEVPGCINGTVTVEEAAANIMKKVNLYLAE